MLSINLELLRVIVTCVANHVFGWTKFDIRLFTLRLQVSTVSHAAACQDG